MLRKLIAYDFRCTWKMALTLFGTSMVAAILSAVCGVMAQYIPFDSESIMYMLASTGLMLGEAFLFMLAYVGSLGTLLLSAVHYYKKMISDEAYLTFTLPATVGQHLTAKLVTGFVWSLIGFVVLFINMVIVSIPDAIAFSDAVDDPLMGDYVEGSVEGVLSLVDIGMVIGIILLLLTLLITEQLLVYLALTIGGVIANKHKAIAGIGLYWVGNSVVSGVMMFTAIIVSAIIASILPVPEDWAIAVILCVCSIVVAGFGAIYYFINRKLLTNHLNLP